MQYCVKCLYPANHPLYITFDHLGVCSGCRVHEEKDQLDWVARLARLKDLVKPFKSTSRSVHDCIIPVSGARDSYFIVHVVKNILGLHPLLVTYNKHYNTEQGIRNLAYLRTKLGCDLLTMTVSPERVKRITRATLKARGSMYWHCLAGQSVFPVQIATKFKIPLIIWGAHQGIDQVGMFSHWQEVEMTRKYRYEHDLMALDSEELLDLNNDIVPADLAQYTYPHDKEIAAVGVRGIYLNNFIRWDSKSQHEAMLKRYAYETAPQQRTPDTYNDVDCFHYSGLHDYLKYLKWGYGKVTDHACREIRLNHITRETGLRWMQYYTPKLPNDCEQFLAWLKMPAAEFWQTIDTFRDPRVWRKVNNTWELRHSMPKLTFSESKMAVDKPFIVQARANVSNRDSYTLIGRGWVD